MAMVGGSQAAVTIVDYRLDLYGGNTRANRGRIAMKSTGPVVALGLPNNSRYWVSEDLSTWASRSEPWVAGSTSSADITVDSSDNYHFAYAGTGINVTYVDHTGDRQVLANEVWSDGSGHVQIVANNDGVHVGWSPKNASGGGDGLNNEYHYQTKSGGDWSAITVLDHTSADLSPRLLGSADEFYYYSIPRDTEATGGPYYQQADDGVNSQTNLYTGLTRGLKTWGGFYDFYLCPAWHGSFMNLASVELNPGSAATTGLVALYLDVQGAGSEVVVFDDSASHGGIGTAGSVALASVGGINYVFFTAEDPGAGTDTEVFVQAVAQNGTLQGSADQLTDDDYEQSELDAASWGSVLDPHLHIVFNTNVSSGDAGERVSYMELKPSFYPANCNEALQQGHGIGTDLNSDCYVNIADFSIATGYWLDCIDPCDVSCTRPWE